MYLSNISVKSVPKIHDDTPSFFMTDDFQKSLDLFKICLDKIKISLDKLGKKL